MEQTTKKNLGQRIAVFACSACALMGLLGGCMQPKTQETATQTVTKPAVVQVAAPEISADSAYADVVKQLSFGPRVSGSVGNHRCGDWLVKRLKAYGATVIEQNVMVKQGTLPIPCRNIIASYYPTRPRRILLAAHWDTRPMADQDSVKANQKKPIPGANDAASGAAILLEAARALATQDPNIGVDLIFWDAEDLGLPNDESTWCLGSQYWAAHPHVANYTAEFGINMDMVGAVNAQFAQEAYSKQYAQAAMTLIWQTGHSLGYGAYFAFQPDGEIIDDHLYVNKLRHIPTVDIIHRDFSRNMEGEASFFPQWHTMGDDLPVISKETLKAVGQTVLQVVYTTGANRKP